MAADVMTCCSGFWAGRDSECGAVRNVGRPVHECSRCRRELRSRIHHGVLADMPVFEVESEVSTLALQRWSIELKAEPSLVGRCAAESEQIARVHIFGLCRMVGIKLMPAHAWPE